ncbi:putative hspc200 [Aspergillus cavernicola]|uniref:Hspc200 n=1 Tax=Aspergillus cavernicola TaxID=176166 RepID=A0ABR4ICL2_9EURO
MSLLFIPPLPPTAPRVERLPSPPRQTAHGDLGEMRAACIAKDFSKFDSVFHRWSSYGFDIHDLSNVMLEAVKQDFPEAVSALLFHGQPMYFSYASEAMRHRATGVLSAFLEAGWDINEPKCPTLPTLLAYSVEDEDMTVWLLNHGADPNQQCSVDLTPLSWAVEGAPLSTIKILLNRGADVHKGEPLHHAINRKSEVIEVLSMLLEHGASLNGKMYENHPYSWRLYFFTGLGTVLHQAAEQGKVDAVKYLLDQGADTAIKNALDQTPLDLAVNNHHQDVIAVLESASQKQHT